MRPVDLAKAFYQVEHQLLLNVLENISVGSVILEGVRMAYTGCSTSLVVCKTIGKSMQVQRSMRLGFPLSPLLVCLYIEAFCLSIFRCRRMNGFQLESCDVRVLAYADDIALIFVDRSSISDAVNTLKVFCTYSAGGVNWQECLGFWHGPWDCELSVYQLADEAGKIHGSAFGKLMLIVILTGADRVSNCAKRLKNGKEAGCQFLQGHLF